MTVTSTSLRSTPAIGAQRANFTTQHADVNVGGFTRPHVGKTQVHAQADQGIGHRIGALFGSSKPTLHEPLSTTAKSLQGIADLYASVTADGEPMHMKTFGKPAVLSGLQGCMVLKSKYSADPSEPSGLLGFKDGEVRFAKSGHPGVPLTQKQQDTMVAAALEAIVSGFKRRS